MNSNDLLLSHLAAFSDDETVLRAMSACTFGLTGEVGEAGFGATTLEGHLVLFTHPEFFAVADLPPSLSAVEATARQAAEYARAVGLVGFVLNPGTHQRFVGVDTVARLHVPLRAPEPPTVPTLVPWPDPSAAVVQAVHAAAEESAVEAVWLASGPAVATHPHPDPAFEAGLLARDVRMSSFRAEPEWTPVYVRDAAPDRARVRFRALSQPLLPALAADLVAEARRSGLRELWAFEAQAQGEEPTLAFAYAQHPHDRFASGFDVLHARHGLGMDVPLLDAASFGETLARIGTRLV